MANAFAAVAVIFGLLAALVGVEHLYRRFARNNPRLGPFRDGGAGCGSCGGCKTVSCDTRK